MNTKCCQTLLLAPLTGRAYVLRNLCLEIPPATPLQASSLRKPIPCCNAHNNNKIWISDRWILSYLAYGVLWACSHDIEADQSFRWIHWALDQALEKNEYNSKDSLKLKGENKITLNLLLFFFFFCLCRSVWFLVMYCNWVGKTLTWDHTNEEDYTMWKKFLHSV